MPTEWTVKQLDYTITNGEPDEVTVAHWEAIEVDGEYSARAYGTVSFEPDHPINNVPFDQLQQQTVIGYVKAILGDDVAAIESRNAGQIAESKNPTKGNSAPPWAQ